MGTVRKRGKAWRAEIAIKGTRKSATFDSKLEAFQWIDKEEKLIVSGKALIEGKTFADLMQKYSEEVSEHKAGKRWEQLRISMILRDEAIAEVTLVDLDETHFAKWRDRRLQSVSSGTVRREWNLLSNALNIAVKEWKWIESNPMKNVRRPAPPKARDRLISQDEIDAMLHVLGYQRTVTPETLSARVGAAILFALETGMRCGEICALKPGDINLPERYLKVTGMTHGAGKTQAAIRDVPLSQEAIRILNQVDLDFELQSGQVDALFRKAKAKAALDGFTFHDTRHTAITNLAKKLNVLELARMVGHRDLKQLNVYYNEKASELAKKL